MTDKYGPLTVTDRERRLVAALADDPIYNTDAQLELCFGPSVGRVVAEMRRVVRDCDAENQRIDAEVTTLFQERYPTLLASFDVTAEARRAARAQRASR